MKQYLLLILYVIAFSNIHAQMKIGNNPTSINSNSLLELEHGSKGMLLPRLSLNSTAAAAPLSAHVAGMVVYNTASVSDVTPGYYYDDGSKWVRLNDREEEPWRNATTLTAATSSSTDITYKGGNMGIALNTPQVPLHIDANSISATAIHPYRVGLLVEAEGSSTGGRIGTKMSTNLVAQPGLFIGYRSRGTSAAPAALQANDHIIGFAASGYGTSAYSGGYPLFVVCASENWTNTANGFRIIFANASNGTIAPAERMRIENDGNVGINTSAPTAKLHVAGTIRFSSLGAGTVQSDANGNLSVSSDARLKTNIRSFNRSINAIMGLEPSLYNWNEKSGLDRENVYAGFIAQNVEKFIPEAVSMDKNGMRTLQDRPIIAALVNCVKEQQKQIKDCHERLDKVKDEIECLKKEIKKICDRGTEPTPTPPTY